MKFQNLTLIFLLIAFGTAYSQNTHLYLKSNTYKIEQNIDALLNKKTFFNPEEVVENRMYFRILSFSQLPD